MKYNNCMFKKSLLLSNTIFLALLIMLSSCSNAQTAISPLLIEETLRNHIENNQNTIIWTDEIDAHILYEEEKDEKKEDTGSSKLSLNPDFEELIRQAEALRAEQEEKQRKQDQEKQQGLKSNKKNENLYMYASSASESVYPSITGFGSLDTRAIDDSVKLLIDDFLSSVKKGKISSSFFTPNRAYISAVLEYSLTGYPEPQRWVLGRPHLQEIDSQLMIEIPVRVWGNQSYFDLWIFVFSTGTAEYIDQVQLGSLIVE